MPTVLRWLVFIIALPVILVALGVLSWCAAKAQLGES